jgi:hypothetical protein
LRISQNSRSNRLTARLGCCRQAPLSLTEHFRQLRLQVRKQHADVLDRQRKHSEAQKLLATQ